jgi:hypothetical protein
MTSIDLNDYINYNKAYDYCLLNLERWEWKPDYTKPHRLKFIERETAMMIALRFA